MYNISKVFAILLLFITIPSYFVFGQDSESTNSLKKGSQALQFQIAHNFTLTSFAGSAFAYKYHISDDQARRIGLSLENSYSEREFPESDLEFKDNRLDLSVGVEFTWMNYTQSDSDMKFYYGYGPRLNIGYEKRDQVTDDRSSDMSRNALGVAGIGYAGIEWFFKSSMSLHAEYGVSAQVNYFRENNRLEIEGIGTENTEYTITTFTFNGDGVRFGLSVYF